MSINQFLLSADTTDLDYPEVRPTLDLNFARVKALDPRITFTRSSGGSYVGADGLIKYAGVNEARFDHDPETGESLGLLIEEARTNSIRNNTMVGAVAGTLPTNWGQSNNTGLAANVIGTGTENGITYIDVRINGTTTGTGQTNILLETNTGVAALTGQTWTLTNYIKVQAGSTANFTSIRLVLQENSSAVVAVAAGAQDMTIPSTPLGSYRPSLTRALSGGATVASLLPYIQCNINTGLAIDITLRIGLPQLEQGAFPTSVIPTTTATRTRAVDNAQITGKNFSDFYNQSEGTAFVDVYNNPSTPNGIAVNFSDTGAFGSNRIQMTNNGIVAYLVNNVVILNNTNVLNTNLLKYKLVTSYKLNDIIVAANGSYVTMPGRGITPQNMTTMTIGSYPGGGVKINNSISRIIYYPKRLPNSQIQALTR